MTRARVATIRTELALIVGVLVAQPAARAQSAAKVPKIGILQVGTRAGAEHLSPQPWKENGGIV